jgi:predicted Fe-Mo cluster-binding NifX family protein
MLIGRSAWELLLESVCVLLDASLPAETLAEIRRMLETEPLVATVKYVTGRNAGRYRFVESEIVLRPRDLAKSREVEMRVEKRIRDTVRDVERVLIHAEPMARTHLRCAAPLADTSGTLSEHFGDAPYFALANVRLADKRIEEQQIVANPHTDVPKAKGIQVAEWLVQRKVDVLLMREDLQGKGPMCVFGDAGVEVIRTESQALKEAIRTCVPSPWESHPLPEGS